MSYLPSPSHYHPKYNQKAPKADLRRPITAWRALIWAYRDECVRAASNSEAPPQGSNGLAMMLAGETGISGGLINGLLIAHDDAMAIDALVYRWFEGEAVGRDGLARCAERARPPACGCDLEPLSCGPIFRANGKVQMEYPLAGRNEPYLCMLNWYGATATERDAADRFHALFVGLLDVMGGLKLVKWRIEGRGLTIGGESLTTPSTIFELRPGV